MPPVEELGRAFGGSLWGGLKKAAHTHTPTSCSISPSHTHAQSGIVKPVILTSWEQRVECEFGGFNSFTHSRLFQRKADKGGKHPKSESRCFAVSRIEWLQAESLFRSSSGCLVVFTPSSGSEFLTATGSCNSKFWNQKCSLCLFI